MLYTIVPLLSNSYTTDKTTRNNLGKTIDERNFIIANFCIETFRHKDSSDENRLSLLFSSPKHHHLKHQAFKTISIPCTQQHTLQNTNKHRVLQMKMIGKWKNLP